MLRVYWEIYEKGLSCRDIANQCGVSHVTISRIINGRNSPNFGKDKSAERIARAVGWTGDVRELFKEITEAKKMTQTLIERLEAKYGSTMTPKDAAAVLHSHPNHIRDMCRNGQLPAVQIGNRWRIPTAKFAEILEGGSNG